MVTVSSESVCVMGNCSIVYQLLLIWRDVPIAGT